LELGNAPRGAFFYWTEPAIGLERPDALRGAEEGGHDVRRQHPGAARNEAARSRRMEGKSDRRQ